MNTATAARRCIVPIACSPRGRVAPAAAPPIVSSGLLCRTCADSPSVTHEPLTGHPSTQRGARRRTLRLPRSSGAAPEPLRASGAPLGRCCCRRCRCRRPTQRSTDPHTVPRARSGASRGKVCYRVLAASAVLVCTCSRGAQPRSAPRVATARAASALARCSMVCRGATHCGPGGLLHRRPRDLHRTGRTFAARRSGASHGAGRWPCTCYHATNRASVAPLIAIRSV